MRPIGIARSCFRERFGIPRQPGLVPDALARLELDDTPELRDALRGLEGFSHVWVIFLFHEAEGFKPLVRPPRLGGARKIGVLATRSPHRPNPIGLSLVRLERVEGTTLHISGVDLLDGTPVLDVKPYIPYADTAPDARAGWVDEEEARPPLEVRFSDAAASACAGRPRLRALIEQLLAQDPRPAFQRDGSGDYGMKLEDVDVRWEIRDGQCQVTGVLPVPEGR